MKPITMTAQQWQLLFVTSAVFLAPPVSLHFDESFGRDVYNLTASSVSLRYIKQLRETEQKYSCTTCHVKFQSEYSGFDILQLQV